MNRQDMVKRLVEAARAATERDETGEGVAALLREGFVGFDRMSDSRLRRELLFRGLMDYDEPAPGDADADEPSEAELMVLLSGMTSSEPTLHFFD